MTGSGLSSVYGGGTDHKSLKSTGLDELKGKILSRGQLKAVLLKGELEEAARETKQEAKPYVKGFVIGKLAEKLLKSEKR